MYQNQDQKRLSQQIAIVRDILSINKSASLSGSIALVFSGVAVRRKVSDIDIYMPYGVAFNKPASLSEDEIPDSGYSDDAGGNDEYTMRTFIHSKPYTKVNVFITNTPDASLLVEHNEFLGISCVVPHEIIKFKIKYALTNSSSSEKHRKDVMFMLEQIEKDTY